MKQSDGHGGGMSGHGDDIESLTEEELQLLKHGGGSGSLVASAAADEIRWLRSKLRTRETELVLAEQQRDEALANGVLSQRVCDLENELAQLRSRYGSWRGDNWWWCGCAGPRGTCSKVTCTMHKDAPR